MNDMETSTRSNAVNSTFSDLNFELHHGTYGIHSFNNHSVEESAGPRTDSLEQDENMTVSLFRRTDPTVPDNTAKYLTLIHEDPVRWNFICANLAIMAEEETCFDAILYVIKTLKRSFCPGDGTNVQVLKQYLDSLSDKKEIKIHLELFSKIAKLILRTPELFPKEKPVRQLVQGQHYQEALSISQCLCIISHMFMCIAIPNDRRFVANFGRVFSKSSTVITDKKEIEKEERSIKVKLEKIKCMFKYFSKAFEEISPLPQQQQQERQVIFERIAAEKIQENSIQEYTIKNKECSLQAWQTCEQKLQKFTYLPKGEMEDGFNRMEVAFSGKSFGGQTLRSKPTQKEKIIFRSPECLPGILLFESITNGEALSVRGARAFNKCSGYENSFKWESYCDDKNCKSPNTEVIFIDAYNFSQDDSYQFQPLGIVRELNKAFIGFDGGNIFDANHNDEIKKAVCTGKWGCGIYNGNIQLKFLIQWIAASRAGREMIFYGFADNEKSSLIKDLNSIEKEILPLYTVKTKDQGMQMMQIKDLVVDILECAKKAQSGNTKEFNLFKELKNLHKSKK